MAVTEEVQTQVVDIATVAAGTAEDRYWVHGLEGEWRLEAAHYVPATADALHATNYTTLSLIGNSTTLGTLDNSAVAFQAGVSREFSLSGGSALEFGETDVLNLDKAESGTGGILDGAIVCRWRKIRA